MKSIIDVNFQQSKKGTFEILTLQDLFNKKLDHLLTQTHRINFNHIFFFTKGQGAHFIDFKKHDYQKRDLLFISAGQVHRFEINMQNDAFILIFTNDFICTTEIDFRILNQAKIFDTLENPKISLTDEQFAYFYHLVLQIKNEYENENNWLNDEILRNQLRIFLFQAERIKQVQNPQNITSSYQKTFFEFKTLLEKNFAICRNTDFYADRLNISTKKLNYIVQEITTKTTKTFIDERVILEIKRLLTHTGLSIKEISHQTGFEEPTNLVKYFKKHTIQTPTEFKSTSQKR